MHPARIVSEAAREFLDWALLLPEKILMSFAVYADATGTHDIRGFEPGSLVAGVCGLFSWTEDWAKLTGEWKEVLAGDGVADFHYRELANGLKYYKGWSTERREGFLLRLATIIGKRTRFNMSAFFNVRDSNETIPQWYRDLGHPPYDLSLKLFFESMLKEFENWFQPDSKNKVVFIFDDTQELVWKESIMWWHAGAKTVRGQEWTHGIADICRCRRYACTPSRRLSGLSSMPGEHEAFWWPAGSGKRRSGSRLISRRQAHKHAFLQ
jgi:hypothetical protein